MWFTSSRNRIVHRIWRLKGHVGIFADDVLSTFTLVSFHFLRIYLDKSYWLFKHLMPLLRFIKEDKNFRVKAVYRWTNKYVICLWCLRPSYPNHRCKHIRIQCLRLYDKFCTNLLFNGFFYAISMQISVIQALMVGSHLGFHILLCFFTGITMLLHRSQADGDHDSRGWNRTGNLPVCEGYL